MTIAEELRKIAGWIQGLAGFMKTDFPRQSARLAIKSDELIAIATRCEGLMASINLARAELSASSVAILDRALGCADAFAATTHREGTVSLEDVEDALQSVYDLPNVETSYVRDAITAILDRLKGGSAT